jgi:outer membrane receptor protein involved in Fe transport
MLQGVDLRRNTLRTLPLALCVAALVFAPRAFAQAAEESFDIPEQRADLALNEFARQAHLVVLFPYEEVSRVAANRLQGKYTVQNGVEALLRDTGLSASVEAGGRQLVVRVFADSADSTEGSQQMGFQQRKGFFASVMAALAALAGSGRATAQDADASVGVLEEVTVTGSRIRETGMNTPVPVTVVTAEQMEMAAPGNLIDAFDQMPQFLGNSAPGTDVFIGTNAGQSILNMRGLGANRTLVLLDGRRVVPSTKQGTLDINVLPESVIKRVEVVTGGASAAYGTDAVAGVTNFILDTDFNGVKGHVQGGETTRGDNANGEASLAFGTAIGERAHFIGSVDYYKSKAIESYDGRDWMQDWGTVLNPAWSPGSSAPQYLVQPHVTSTLYTFGGMINAPGTPLDRLMFLSDGSAVPFVPGSIANFNSTYLRSQTGGIGDNIERDRASDAGLIPNVERYNGFGHLTYEINDNWEAFGQVLLGRNKVDGNGFADVMHGPAFQGTIYSGNPYLPANLQDLMTANGIGSFNLSRMGSSADLSVNRLIQTNQTDSYTVGLKGNVGDWRVNTYYQYGRNEGEMRAVNVPRTDRLFLAMDAVIDPTTHAITCNVNLANPGYGCIPINLLGSGRASQQAIDYVTAGTKTANTVNEQNAFELSVDGEIFKDWAPGPVSLAVGVAYRKDELRQTVDDPSNPTNDPSFVSVPRNNAALNIRGIPVGFAGVNSGVQFSIVPNFSGEITTKEAFTEVLVPLLKDLRFAQQLNLSAAARYANYSGSGGVWSWKGGLDWQAIDALRLRGTVSRDVRAANMSERFDSAGGGATVRDPFLSGNPTVNFTQITGGNPNVEPEKADTLTFGIVLQPPQVQGLSMSVDWYSIDVKGSIGQLSAQQIVTSCFQGNTALCDRITRDANGQISGLSNLYLNINAAKVRGTDMEVDYNHHVGPGQLGLRLLASWLGENSVTNFGLPKQDRAGETGALSFPEWQANAGVTYSQGPFTAFLQERYIGAGMRRYNDNLLPTNVNGGITIDNDRVSPMYYTDVQASYRFELQNESNLDVFLNVTNLFDRDPPIAANYSDFGGSVQTNANLFDVLGRRFVLGARFEF